MLLIQIFVYLGTVAAGISGALTAIQKRLDWFGVVSLCTVTSLGGGVVRDLMIGRVPPVALVEPGYFLVSLAAAAVTLLFYERIGKLQTVIMLSDAIGLGVFTAVGADAAVLQHWDKPFILMSMGLITGIGGGVMRDVFSGQIPYVFHKEVYALASLLGAGSFVLTYHYIPIIASLYICLFVTFGIRVVSVAFNFNFPVFGGAARPAEGTIHAVKRHKV